MTVLQATLPMRARMSPHITLNPYSTQLVDNLNRMMTVSPGGHIYQVAGPAPGLAPHLSNLTNTLKKKKKCCNDPRCSRGVAGAQCPHSRTITPLGALASDSSARSESLTPVSGQEQDTDTELLPASASLASAEVVFRAVSPHGHVYWEIDPKRPGRLAGNILRTHNIRRISSTFGDTFNHYQAPWWRRTAAARTSTTCPTSARRRGGLGAVWRRGRAARGRGRAAGSVTTCPCSAAPPTPAPPTSSTPCLRPLR